MPEGMQTKWDCDGHGQKLLRVRLNIFFNSPAKSTNPNITDEPTRHISSKRAILRTSAGAG